MKESVSLPRIRQSDNNLTDISQQAKLKFKKLRLLNISQQEKYIRKVKTDRSHSQVVLSSLEDKKNIKNKKIEMNMVEKKIRQGNYDQKQQIGDDLEQLKRKCSSFMEQNKSKSNQIEKLRKKLQKIRYQMSLGQKDINYFNERVQQTRDRYIGIRAKCQQVLYERDRLSKMINDRKNDNLTLNFHAQQKNHILKRLRTNQQIAKRADIEAKQNLVETEIKYQNIVKQIEVSQKGLKKMLETEKLKISKYTQNEINRDDRHKKLINITTSVVIEQEEKQFKKGYDQYLGQKFIYRFLETKFSNLIQSSQKIVYLFQQANALYGPFSPQQFPAKFSNLGPEKDKISEQVKQFENKQTELQNKLKSLKQKSASLQIEYLSLGEQLTEKFKDGQTIDSRKMQKAEESLEKLEIIDYWCDKQLSVLEKKPKKRHSQTQLSCQDKVRRILNYLQTELLNIN